MAKPFKKAWNYLMASADNAVDEHADPKVQIQQAIEEHQTRHQALQQQAAAVIGNQRQLEMKLNRQLGEIEKLQASARQALVLSDRQRAAGDETGAQRYEETAQVYASQLITGEQSLEDLKTLHGQAAAAAASAKQAVERNTMLLQQKMAERTKLLSQLEQANMAEQSAAALRQMTDTADSGAVPSLEGVRDKIELRYANAMGQAELAQNSVQGRMLEVQAATIDMAGQNRLEQIRASLRGTPVAPAAVTAGSEPDALPASAPTPATASNVSDLRAKLGVHTQNG